MRHGRSTSRVTLPSFLFALLFKVSSPSSQRDGEDAAVISISQNIAAFSITCVLVMLCLLTEASISRRVWGSIVHGCVFQHLPKGKTTVGSRSSEYQKADQRAHSCGSSHCAHKKQVHNPKRHSPHCVCRPPEG